MGNSFTAYRGKGFWSRDSFIELLAGDVAAAIELLPTKERWLEEMAAHWKLQASGNFSGWVHLNLDEFAVGEQRRVLIRELVRGASLLREEDDLVRQTGLLLLRLLDGQLSTTAESPLDYMVGVPPPRPRKIDEEIDPLDPDAALKRRLNEGFL